MKCARICCFFVTIILLGIATIYSINQGTMFLELHDAPARPEAQNQVYAVSQNGGSLQYRVGRASMSTFPNKISSSIQSSHFPLKREDLAVAIVTDLGHEDYVRFSRSWRQGLNTYVGTNHSLSTIEQHLRMRGHNETWGCYPDDKPLHTLALKGDSRAALAPFLAYRELGDNFKWILYGDDDTYFFVDAVMKNLQKLDPATPYFLTDHLWWTEKWIDNEGNPRWEEYHPHRAAPTCVPCSYTADTSKLTFPHPRGCPCTTATLCNADKKGIFFRGLRGQCGMPRVPIRTYSMHGGAGAILSIGLLKNISFKAFEDCVTTTYTTGGDAVISICLWQMGFGMTTPNPEWHPEGLYMFDIGREGQSDHEEIISRVAKPMGRLLQAASGDCDSGTCKLELDHFLTLHMRSRKFPSKACHAEVSRILALLTELAISSDSKLLNAKAAEASVQEVAHEFINQQLALALRAYKHHTGCQAGQQRIEPLMCREIFGSLNRQGKPYLAVIEAERDELATPDLIALKLAVVILEHIFRRFPSPTGAYGEIPFGKE